MSWIEDRVRAMVKVRRIEAYGDSAGWQRVWSRTTAWVAVIVLGRAELRTPKQMKVVETLTLGPKKQLVLLSCGRDRFLVGTSAEGVQSIVRVRGEVGAGETKVIETVAEDWVR